MDLGLAGKRALITGGSRGIGRSVVSNLLDEGCRVEFCARNEEGVAAAEERYGEAAKGSAVDITDEAGLRAWVAAAADRLGGVDIVISNASALGGIPKTLDGWKQSFAGDIVPTVVLVEEALPHLEASDAGAIVQLGTITAVEHHVYEPGGSSYGALKAALINYMAQLAQFLAPKGVRANTVSPGPIYIEDGSWGYLERRMPDYYRENLEHHPSGRMGRPEEVANVVTFVASPAASWLTGENIVVDGGFTRRVAF